MKVPIQNTNSMKRQQRGEMTTSKDIRASATKAYLAQVLKFQLHTSNMRPYSERVLTF